MRGARFCRPDLLATRHIAGMCLPARLPLGVGADLGGLRLERVGSRRVRSRGVGLGPAARLVLAVHPAGRLLGSIRVLHVRPGSITWLPVAAHARQF